MVGQFTSAPVERKVESITDPFVAKYKELSIQYQRLVDDKDVVDQKYEDLLHETNTLESGKQEAVAEL